MYAFRQLSIFREKLTSNPSNSTKRIYNMISKGRQGRKKDPGHRPNCGIESLHYGKLMQVAVFQHMKKLSVRVTVDFK